jgi:hypothetical protein
MLGTRKRLLGNFRQLAFELRDPLVTRVSRRVRRLGRVVHDQRGISEKRAGREFFGAIQLHCTLRPKIAEESTRQDVISLRRAAMASLKKRPGNPIYYIQFYVGTQQRRVSTETDSYQRAKDKIR